MRFINITNDANYKTNHLCSQPPSMRTYIHIHCTYTHMKKIIMPLLQNLCPLPLSQTHMLACLLYLYRKYKMYSKTEKVTLQNITE